MENKTPTDADAAAKISDAMHQLDEQRMAGLNNLKAFQQVRDTMQQQEVKRLSAKYGANHPRVQQLNARLSYNPKMFQSLDTEIGRVSIKTAPLPANSWRIQGRVYDAQDQPMKGVTVFLADDKKEWVRQLGSSCSDEGGNYSLTLDEKTTGSTKKQTLFLSASDKNKKLIYTSETPAVPSKGIVDVVDIRLSGDQCVTPPEPPATDDKTGGQVK